MFEDYACIFTRRGADYDSAMRRFPEARREEFAAILDLAAPRPGETLIDLPAGGGYLQDYLDPDAIHLIAIEPAPVFHALCRTRVGESHLVPLTALPLPDQHADVVLSLAGLHHETRRLEIFREVIRVLRPRGRFAIAEVAANSGPARFLNEFVHQHNPNGHEGLFADDDFRAKLTQAGFTVVHDDVVNYHWQFHSQADMAEYLHLLFGLALATHEQIIDGVAQYLGFDLLPDENVRMNWSIRRLLGIKP
jgi:SAM-dependent methyltransferase